MNLGGLLAIAAACVPPGEDVTAVLDGDLPYPGFEPDELKCDVCGQKACGVGSSSMGPMSFAYCTECNAANREPYGALVGGLMACTSDPANWAPWVMKVVEPTLAFFHKTLDDLKKDINTAWAEYEETMGKLCETEPAHG